MKKIFVFSIVFILLLSARVFADDITVESITIDPPVGDCNYQWNATIRNNTSQQISDPISVQGAQGDGQGYWKGATGTSIMNMAPGETRTVWGKWIRMAGAAEFKVTLRISGQVVAEQQVQLSAEPAPNVSISDGQFTPNNYVITVTNNDMTNPISDLTVQCYKALANDPTSFSPCGGANLECIPAGQTGQRIGPAQPGYDIFKIILFRKGQTLEQRIFGEVPEEVQEEPTDNTETTQGAQEEGSGTKSESTGKVTPKLKGIKSQRKIIKKEVKKELPKQIEEMPVGPKPVEGIGHDETKAMLNESEKVVSPPQMIPKETIAQEAPPPGPPVQTQQVQPSQPVEAQAQGQKKASGIQNMFGGDSSLIPDNTSETMPEEVEQNQGQENAQENPFGSAGKAFGWGDNTYPGMK